MTTQPYMDEHLDYPLWFHSSPYLTLRLALLHDLAAACSRLRSVESDGALTVFLPSYPTKTYELGQPRRGFQICRPTLYPPCDFTFPRQLAVIFTFQVSIKCRYLMKLSFKKTQGRDAIFLNTSRASRKVDLSCRSNMSSSETS